MRTLTLTAVVLFCTVLSTLAQVGHWRLDNNGSDASSNNIDGTLQNSPTFSTDKKEGTHALVLNGGNQYIDLGNPTQFPSGTSAKTISAWAKTNVTTGNGVIFSYGSPSTSQAFYLGMNGTTLVGGAFGNSLTETNIWTTDTWQHVCMTYDGATVRLYANGVEVNSATRSWGVVLQRAYIGRHVNNNNYWNGSIDDVRIYNSALSASEVAALAATGPLAPEAPTNPTATAISATQINLTWTDNANNETEFQIERSEISASTGFSLIHTTAANVVSYSNIGLTAGVTYYYRISAVNGNGNSAAAEITATTTNLIPAAPTNLALTAVSSTAINVSWNDNSTNETGFQIYRSATLNGTYSLIHTTAANITTYQNGGLTATTTYYYQVRATNASGSSGYTTKESATTLSEGGSGSGPVGMWKLNNNLDDESGNGYHGTLIGSPVFSTDKKEGSHALSFDGTGYVDLGNPAGLPFGIAPRSISVWAKTNTEEGDHMIVAYGTPASMQGMFIGQSGTALFIGGWSSNEKINNFWETGAWHHICLTYDGTTAKVYADGEEISSTPKSWNLVLLRAYIGRHLTNNAYWDGSVDDVRIYNRTLTPSEVAALAETTTPQVPVAPTNLTATTISAAQINLTWTDNSNNETGFLIERSSTSSTAEFVVLNTTAPNVVSFSNQGLTAGMTYYYRVSAVNANGTSAYTEANAATSSLIPIAPSNLVVTASSSTAINVSWSDNSTNETGFQIYRSGTLNGTYSLIHTSAANVTSYLNGSLTPETEYYYQVRATNASGTSAYTSKESTTTLSEGGSGDGPVGLWKLNNNVNDESGNGYHGTLIGSSAFSTDKKEGSHALSFDGTGYVELGNPAGLPSGTSARSISVWAKTNTTTGDHMIAAYGTNAYSQAMFIGQSQTSLFVGAWGSANNILVENIWDDNHWHHICLTYDGTTAKVYVDGKEEASEAKTWNLVLERAYIGRHLSNTAYWDGSIDDIRIYDKALSLGEVQGIKNESDPVQQVLNDYAFQYRYDARKRMTQKKVPGADWVYMVYDHRDRLVLTQDGNQRAKKDDNDTATPQWTFTKYDALNRPILTGIYTHSEVVDQETMQIFVNGQYGAQNEDGQYPAEKFYEDFNEVASTMGYTNRTFPNTNTDILTVTYYDRYNFRSMISGTDDEYTPNELDAQEEIENQRVLGQVTGTQVKVLGAPTPTFLWSVNYYDDKYRVIQNIALNQLGGRDIVTNVYDFIGKVMNTRTTHNAGSPEQQIIERKFNYDHAGRLMKTWHKLNAQDWVLLTMNEYNELGQLVTKKLHNTDSEQAYDETRQFKQNVDYRYNIRGWLESVNDLSEPEAGDLFGMNLHYNNPTANGGAPQYNGNISEIQWKGPDAKTNSYGYNYDPMNRLTEANFYNATNGNRFNEQIKSPDNKSGYDLNGNILFLQRNGKTGIDAVGITTYGEMDKLKYEYRGNQLLKVTDDAIDTQGFVDGSNTDNDYDYDKNGNMIIDKNKSIDDATTAAGKSVISYNYLNLPEKVVKSNGEYLKYIYDATGRKLSQEVYNASNELQKKSDYAGEFFYEDNTLKFVNHDEGRVVMSGSQGEYQYHLKDHLGNVRLTFTTKEELESVTATLEDAKASTEHSQFLNYVEVRKIDNKVFDHTDEGGTYNSIRLMGGNTTEVYGLAKTLSVMPGDVIRMEVYAKYLDPVTANWSAALQNVISSIAGSGNAGGTYVDGGQLGTIDGAFPHPGLLVRENDEGAGPKAYLNYLVFDRDFNYLTGGFERVSTAARESGTTLNTNAEGVNHERLHFDDGIVINEAGYVYIYLSNENETPVEVFFDDFRVEHVKSPVVQMDDYYPFGLTFNSYRRESTTSNDYLYQDKERQDELQLGVYDFHARMYDPAIGRTFQVDPHSDSYFHASPYSWVGNNPLLFIDPTGMDIEQTTKKYYRDKDGTEREKAKVSFRRTTRIERTIKVSNVKILNSGGENESTGRNPTKAELAEAGTHTKEEIVDSWTTKEPVKNKRGVEITVNVEWDDDVEVINDRSELKSGDVLMEIGEPTRAGALGEARPGGNEMLLNSHWSNLDAVMQRNDGWDASPGAFSYESLRIASHEFGHMGGLKHAPNSIMQKTASGGRPPTFNQYKNAFRGRKTKRR